MSRVAAAIIALAFIAAPAFAASTFHAELRLASREPVHLDGRVVASARDTGLRLDAQDETGVIVLDHVSGTLHVYTGRTVVTNGKQGLPSSPDDSPIQLTDARVTIVLDHEPSTLVARVTDRGAVGLTGEADAIGRPTPLPTDIRQTRIDALRPQDVDRSWDRGWLFVGASEDPDLGFPRLTRPEAFVRGDANIAIGGGNLSTVAADGRPVQLALGEHEDASLPGGALREVTWTSVRLEGTVGEGRAPAPEWSGFAAPRVEWQLDGVATWHDASGDLVTSEGTRSVQHADVAAVGVLALSMSSDDAAGTLAPWTYPGAGELTELRVDGAPVHAAAQGLAPAVVGGAGLGLAALLVLARAVAFRVWGALYTRIAPAHVLDHPARQRILALAREAPGIHARELQRRSGLGWGGFRAHLAVLASAKHVRIERTGRYRAIVPVDADVAPTPWLPSPVARSIFDVVQSAAGPISVAECRARVGVSRQLMDHHVAQLARRDLVTLATDPMTGERRLARGAAQIDGPKS